MKGLWTSFNQWLNFYGGLISLIGIVISIFITIKTGQIKNNIKNLLSHDKYIKQKAKTKKNVQSILTSINEDDLYDSKLLGDIYREVSAMDHYSIFFDKKMQNNMKSIKKLLNDNGEKHDMILALSKLLGDLDANDVYVG